MKQWFLAHIQIEDKKISIFMKEKPEVTKI